MEGLARLDDVSKPIIALGIFILLTGVLIGLAPDRFLDPTNWDTRGGLYAAASIRVITGSILILGAPASRYPVGLRMFGAVVVLAGLILFVLPLELWAGLLRWAFSGQPMSIRVGGVVGGTLLGLFLIHAARPHRDRTLRIGP